MAALFLIPSFLDAVLLLIVFSFSSYRGVYMTLCLRICFVVFSMVLFVASKNKQTKNKQASEQIN